MEIQPRGRFPFGLENSVRPMRMTAGAASALVVGVYPSAFHVSWTSASSRIASLAVDVEPVVFWNGSEPPPSDLLAMWKQRVRFREDWGRVAVGHNGPSGDFLEKELLTPLGLSDASQVAFTDAVPWFFAKGGRGSQSQAVAERFAPFAAERGIHPGSLPSRPSPRNLVGIATGSERRESLRDEILRSNAQLVITLGDEALQAVRGVADSVQGVQEAIGIDGYGAAGELTVGSTTMEFRPLAHPGLLRQMVPADPMKSTPWKAAHLRWRRSLE